MTFLHWVKYPHMMVCVHSTEDNGFHCSKYVGGNKVHGVGKQLASREELRTFLFELPSAPVEAIEEFIQRLE